MITEIKKGDRFVCVSTDKLHGAVVGKIYKSDIDGEIALEPHYKCGINKSDSSEVVELFNKHFIPYTYEAIWKAYKSSKSNEEAERFAILLKELEASLGRSTRGGGNYRSRMETCPFRPDPDTQHELSVEDIKGNTLDQKFCARIVTDEVNHPPHYTDGKIEVIDFIEDKKFGYNLGNAVKYISRAGKKDPDKTVQDLQKAVWYVQREIARLSAGKEASCVQL